MSEQVQLVQVYVGIGCNLGERVEQLNSAIRALESHPDCQELRRSSFYETEPMGPADQPDYVNAVVGFRSALSAEDLLNLLQSIEQEHGRQRTGERWGPRTLDLDLLLFGDAKINTSRLTVPHPGIAERSFVLMPLSELAPRLEINGLGDVETLLTRCQLFGIRRLNLHC